MEAALSLLIIQFSAPLSSLEIGCSSKVGSQSQLIIATSSGDGLLIGWTVSGMPSHVSAYW